MRMMLLLSTTALLSACGGAGPTSVGSSAPPTSVGGTPAPTSTHTFVKPTEPRTYRGIGSTHSYEYTVLNAGTPGAGQSGQLYQGDANTVRNSEITIAYDPRDNIFNVNFQNDLAGTTQTIRFQDPIHRTNFGGAVEPQLGTPNLAAAPFNLPGMNYLEAGASDNVTRPDPNMFVFHQALTNQPGTYDISTFFYQTPGTETQYVSFAGFLRNSATVTSIAAPNAQPGDPLIERQDNKFERGATAYGEITANGSVPTTGTATFSGSMLATLVFNDQPDVNRNFDTYFQWLAGRATTTVDFARNSFTLGLTGTVSDAALDGTSGQFTLQSGASFTANGSGVIDLARVGGFNGQFQEAWFTNPGGQRLDLLVGGSSIDGAFYGPAAQEVGGGYRIVGGTPDQRIDILGTFVGK